MIRRVELLHASQEHDDGNQRCIFTQPSPLLGRPKAEYQCGKNYEFASILIE